jgi:predicted N-acetyltransferase YhbS
MAGRGIGQLLVRTAEEAARKLGYDTFEIVATLTGVPLYRKAEYRMHGRYSLALPRGGSFPIAFMSRSDRDSAIGAATEACGAAGSRRSRYANVGLL